MVTMSHLIFPYDFVLHLTGENDTEDGHEKAIDTIHGRIVNIDLDVDADYNGTINDSDEPLEETQGGIVCLSTNSLTPINLKIEPKLNALPGIATLSATAGGNRIRLWQNANCTGPITLPMEWKNGATVPGTLYVEGITNSAAACDVALRLEYDENPVGQSNPLFKCEDRIRLTILRMESETEAMIPPNRTRKTIGVGESVKIYVIPSDVSGAWSTTGGQVYPPQGNSTTLEASHNASLVNVTFSSESGYCCSILYTILSPSGCLVKAIQPAKFGETNIAGASMLLDLWLTPTNVSFYEVEIIEVGAISTNATGYFVDNPRFDKTWLIHNEEGGANNWVKIDGNNYIGQDLAAIYGLPPPWSDGHFTLPIPAGWRVTGDIPTNTLPWSDQSFAIDTNGTVTVQKFGHGVTRTINDEIINVY